MSVLRVSALLLLSICCSAQTFSVLDTFTGSPDSAGAYLRLVRDRQGNFYGATIGGGADPEHSYCTTYRLPALGVESVLHSFTGTRPINGQTEYAAQRGDAGENISPTFTTIDVPGAGLTVVTGINSQGDMVGSYETVYREPDHGFVLRNGLFTFFDYPGATYTRPWGINDSGVIAGEAELNGFEIVGFLYNGTTFRTIRHGTNSATTAQGINNLGSVVGGTGTPFTTKGFEMHGTMFAIVSPPGLYSYVYDTGINDRGEVVGWSDDDGFQDGFLYANRQFTTIDYPGADFTEALGINDHGVVSGSYGVGSRVAGFVWKSKYVSFSYPGAPYTAAYGINCGRQVVGSYSFDYTTYHGFVTSSVTAAEGHC